MQRQYTQDGFLLNGWRSDLEQREELKRTSTDVSAALRKRVSVAAEFDPRFIFKDHDPRDPIQVEDQLTQGSCAGHAGSSVVEYTHWLDTGVMIQLSRGGLYYMAQQVDGISGDRGSTISGCCKVITEFGVPPESVWPYPEVYDPTPPGGMDLQRREAEPFKIKSHTYLNSAEETMAYLKSAIGGVQIGVTWGGEVDSYGVFRWRPEGGGHSVALFGWKVKGGEDFTWMLNSWGTRWGDNGWALVSIRTLAKMLRERNTVFCGYSDMLNPDHRDVPVDFIDTPSRF